MNEMELLRELAQETPLPAPAELDAARARLVAAIAADPAAGRVTAVAEVAMHQPDPSSGQPVEPLRPPAPAPVLDAVKLMYGGAVGTVVQLIIALVLHRRHQGLPPDSARAPPHHGPAHPLATAHHHAGDSRRPGRDRPVAVDGAGDRPGQELGAHPVHGAVRPGDAGAERPP